MIRRLTRAASPGGVSSGEGPPRRRSRSASATISEKRCAMRRKKPVGGAVAVAGPGVRVTVPPGFYDAQAIRERDGRVLNIRWAERLVVMAYPDEAGHHLEVINFQNGFGALEVRARDGSVPDATLFAAGSRQQE